MTVRGEAPKRSTSVQPPPPDDVLSFGGAGAGRPGERFQQPVVTVWATTAAIHQRARPEVQALRAAARASALDRAMMFGFQMRSIPRSRWPRPR